MIDYLGGENPPEEYTEIVTLIANYLSQSHDIPTSEATNYINDVIRKLAERQSQRAGSLYKIKWIVRRIAIKLVGEKLVNHIRIIRKKYFESSYLRKLRAKRKIDKVRGIPGFPYSDSEVNKEWEEIKIVIRESMS